MVNESLRQRRRIASCCALIAALNLLAGLAGGLSRWQLLPSVGVLLAYHGAWMVCGFFGSVISLERAAALHVRVGFAVPALSGGLASAALLAGWPETAFVLWQLAGAGLVALYAYAGWQRGWSMHLIIELLGAAFYGLGAWRWVHVGPAAAAASWLAFLLLTIAGERRELAQFVRLSRVARASFIVAVVLLSVGTLAAGWSLASRDGLQWLGIALLAVWLLRYDFALRQWAATSWSGHTARCLLVGYVWLAIAVALHVAGSDSVKPVAMHAVWLGFVMAMVFGHAPLILPALSGVRLAYTHAAQVPLAVMAASLLARMVGLQSNDRIWLVAAGIGHVAAIALFAAVMLRAARRARGQAG